MISLFQDRNGEPTDFEGVVTTIRSTTEFDVNGEPVSVANDAEVTRTPTTGPWVAVEGTVDGETSDANMVHVKSEEDLS